MSIDFNPEGPTPEHLIWAHELLASLRAGLEEDDPEAEGEDEQDDEDTGEDGGESLGDSHVLAEDVSPEVVTLNAVEDPDAEIDTGTDVLDAIFGWLWDLFESVFGQRDDDAPVSEEESDPPVVPADVSEDLVYVALQPDDDFDPYAEELPDDLDLDL